MADSRSESYGYDKNSNRVNLTEDGKSYSYQYYKNQKNGNTARVKFDGTWYYEYDANGNRTVRAKVLMLDDTIDTTKEYWNYSWDYHNRLVGVEQHNAPDNAANVKVQYSYDVHNKRISRTSLTNGNDAKEVTGYAYGRNGALTFEKKSVTGKLTSRTFVYLENQIVGFVDSESEGKKDFRYTAVDSIGSVTEVYSADGETLWKSDYTAFGIGAGAEINLIDFGGMFTGKDTDEETGLSYHWNRWRSEDGSVWLSEDPARDGSNWYGYCGNNPWKYTDPLGLTTLDDYAYQKETNGDWSHEQAEDFQNKAAERNQGYSEYTNNCPNLKINPGKTVSEQLAFLKNYYNTYKNASGKVKGLAAKNLRDELRIKFDLYELFWGHQGDKVFMNETLRDFLNTSDDGSEYSIDNLINLINQGNDEWTEKFGAAANEHQYSRDLNYPNRKFVNKDGREAVFTFVNGKYVLSNNARDKGTFNYAKSVSHFSIISEHGMYDMDPYFEQFGIQPKLFGFLPYRAVVGVYFSSFDYEFQGY